MDATLPEIQPPAPSTLVDKLKARLAQNVGKIRKQPVDETSDEAHFKRVYDDPEAWSGSIGRYG